MWVAYTGSMEKCGPLSVLHSGVYQYCMSCYRHSAIASYLHSQGYKETLEAFKSEADTVSLPSAFS